MVASRPSSPQRPLALVLGTLALGALLAVGCGKKHGDASAEPEASGSEAHGAHEPASASDSSHATAPHPSESASHAASGSALATASAPTGPSATSVATVAPTTTTTTTTTPSSSGSVAAITCGEKGQPKCPLQAWMSTVMQPALASKDAAKLAAALRQCAKYAPPGYPDWAKLSTDGATAIDRARDVSAGKKSCTDCHNLYKAKYKAEARARPI